MAKSVLNAPQFQTEAAAFAYVEARLWPDGAYCPHCGECERVGRLGGKTTRIGLHKCYSCKGQFTVRQGTIFESSHLPLHLWLQVIHLMCASKKGISTRQIQRMLDCSMKTAWFLTHRIREAMGDGGLAPLGGGGGDVEADETYIGRDGNFSAKGGKNMNAILSMVDRQTGHLRSVVLDNVNANNVTNVLGANLSQDTRLLTDSSNVYRRMGSALAGHEAVNHSKGEYVRETDVTVHTNTVEGTFSIFKRGMRGIYQHCSRKHLHRYLAEFDFRYSNRIAVGIDDSQRADNALAGVRGKRLTYETVSRRWPSAEARIVW
ncbi:IS1595 family transposase [Phenylobacterium sp.]|jgi:transposase-like protein|uniref:IS1595 family transposase n=1 Tax=Phenylobacterium sp. TaxID=1871053 RepID=UPI002E347B97|nr:IS1595 family transposase [Phenylobacterium sp.]HEX3367623.1 IS1595 family transposase [Phenylobacterium sp.]